MRWHAFDQRRVVLAPNARIEPETTIRFSRRPLRVTESNRQENGSKRHLGRFLDRNSQKRSHTRSVKECCFSIDQNGAKISVTSALGINPHYYSIFLSRQPALRCGCVASPWSFP